MRSAPLLALLLLTPLSSPPARARDLSGHLGLGAQVDTTHGGALSAKYWVSDFGLQGLFALDYASDTGTAYRPAVRILYAMTRTRRTNLSVFAGLSTRLGKNLEGVDNTAFFDLGLDTEFFLNDVFAVSARVTLAFELGGLQTRIVEPATFASGFHYYF